MTREDIPEKKINENNDCLGEPCIYCDVDWGSIECFIKRGYIWDRVNRFAKGDDGKPLRIALERRECKKLYEGET